MESADRPRVGISTCLLGQNVRYDGQPAHDQVLQDALGRLVEWVPVCPEVELGLPVPRPPIRLCGDPRQPRLLVAETGEDLTRQMEDWARSRVSGFENLAGFVLKCRSPSCGLRRVKVYDQRDEYQRVGTGLFARALLERFPDLAVEEDESLHDKDTLEKFIEQIL